MEETMSRQIKHREIPRVEWNTAARIRFYRTSVTLPCIVHSLSDIGAGITAPNVATLPDEFILELSRGGARARDCRVVWRRKSEVGVTFVAVVPAEPKARSTPSKLAKAIAGMVRRA